MDLERRCTSSGQEKASNYWECTLHLVLYVYIYISIPFPPRNRVSNDKPSAIFRLRGTFSSSSASAAQTRFSSYSTSESELNTTQDVVTTAILGLSIEPLQQIQYQMSSTTTGSAAGSLVVTKPDIAKDPTFLAERIVKHLFNYISGFLGDGLGPDVMIPMALIARWYESFLGKVKAGGVGFLERGE